MSYKDAGVDISKGNLFVKQIKGLAKSTNRKGVLTDIGSFGGLFRLDAKRYKEPVLVSSTDGVGTKLMIAQELGLHNTVGFDLVGMCVNDVATTGAQPLFFLDYIATGRLDTNVLKAVVSGIAQACKQTGYALIGGETAEMPGMYKPGEYDLAGFCVGVVDRRNIIDGSGIKKGDLVLGLASSGLHSNGYSLVRKVFSRKEQRRLRNELLSPTKLYTQPIIALRNRIKVKGIAHITGGAYVDKIPRIIPKGLGVEIKKGSWPMPNIFKLIQAKGGVCEEEMYRVFNMGIGMVVVLSPKDVRKSQNILSKNKVRSWVIGEVIRGYKQVKLV
ncbi:MAG: phosphoribosylformylglycinamidine cyclo-ligase [Candidatus Omnitrophota bacterium]